MYSNSNRRNKIFKVNCKSKVFLLYVYLYTMSQEIVTPQNSARIIN